MMVVQEFSLNIFPIQVDFILILEVILALISVLVLTFILDIDLDIIRNGIFATGSSQVSGCFR